MSSLAATDEDTVDGLELPGGTGFDPARGVDTFRSYTVTTPWRLGFMENGYGSGSVQCVPPSGYNIVFSAFVPDRDDGGSMPFLKMKYDCPFWEMRGRKWELFKKRVVAFSRKNPDAEGLCSIEEADLDDLRDRLSGRWENRP